MLTDLGGEPLTELKSGKVMSLQRGNVGSEVTMRTLWALMATQPSLPTLVLVLCPVNMSWMCLLSSSSPFTLCCPGTEEGLTQVMGMKSQRCQNS